MEHLPQLNGRMMQRVKAKDLTAKQLLAVSCPTCGAAVGEVCELNTGAPRTEPHRDRKLSAADSAEKLVPQPFEPS